MSLFRGSGAASLRVGSVAAVRAYVGSRLVGAASGVPTATSTGNLPERTYTSTTAVTLTATAVGDTSAAAANGTAFRAAISNTTGTDPCLTFAPPATAGHVYYIGGHSIEYLRDGALYGRQDIGAKTGRNSLTLKGTGPGVIFQAVSENYATWFITQNNLELRNFTKRVAATSRSSLGEAGGGSIWSHGTSGLLLQDVVLDGSRDTAFMLRSNSTNVKLNRVTSKNSKSDAFHLAYGASYVEMWDCISENSGDDGIGIVSYGTAPHHMTVTRHWVKSQTGGRGIGLIGCNNIKFQGWLVVENSWRAALEISCESQSWGPTSIFAVDFDCPVWLINSNGWQTGDQHTSGSAIHSPHGAIHIWNSGAVAGATISGVSMAGPVYVKDTGKDRVGGSDAVVTAHGPGPVSSITLNSFAFHGINPTLRLWQYDGASVTPVGWNASSATTAGEPPAWPPGTSTPPTAVTAATAAFGQASGTSLAGLATDTGDRTWSTAGAIAVQNGRARVTNQGDPGSTATIDTGIAGDFDVQARLYGKTGANYPTVVGAYVDNNNKFQVTGFGAGDVQVSKTVGSVATNIAQPNITWVDGDLIRFTRVGGVLTVFKNGAQAWTSSGHTELPTATRVGISGAAYDAVIKIEFDDFSAVIA